MVRTTPEKASHKADIRATFAVGELFGALKSRASATLNIFAGRKLRQMLVAALRREGHVFSDMRFHAWFAGLATLSEEPARHARPAHAVCAAILADLADGSSGALSELAIRLQSAFLAPRHDHEDPAHAKAQQIVAAARDLMTALPESDADDPPAALDAIYASLRAHPLFAPPQVDWVVSPGGLSAMLAAAPPSPLWALELQLFRRPFAGIRAPFPLLLPGLLQSDGATGPDDEDAGKVRADALAQCCKDALADLWDAEAAANIIALPAAGRRITSRAPDLMALLAGFGPLRSRQIETVMDVSRIGVRGMIEAWDERGAIRRHTVAGSHLFAFAPPLTASPLRNAETRSSFSSDLLGEYEASLADIDALLARSARPLGN